MAKHRRTLWVTLVVVVIIAAIILGVLGGLGYFKKKGGASPLVIPAGGSTPGEYGGPTKLILSNPYPLYHVGVDLPYAISYQIDSLDPSTCAYQEGLQCSEMAYITLTYSDGTTSETTNDITHLHEAEISFEGIPSMTLGGVTRSPAKVDIKAQQTKLGVVGPMSNVLSYTMPPPKH